MSDTDAANWAARPVCHDCRRKLDKLNHHVIDGYVYCRLCCERIIFELEAAKRMLEGKP